MKNFASDTISRRSFLAGSLSLGLGATAALAATNVAFAEDNTNKAEDITWDDEADVVILGTGAAGLSAAVTIYSENLGTALILEAAPEEFNGGNSRVCGQGVFCPTSVEGAVIYQTELNGSYTVEPKLIEAWAQNICENIDWLTDTIGFDAVQMGLAEFPEAEASDTIVWYSHEGGGPDAATWNLLMDAVTSYDVPILYETRGTKLIKEDGKIIGVTSEDGRNFKANKGVILACGGFEANQQMMNGAAPIGFPGIRPNGTWYNRGDGITMCREVGADFWHMNNFSGNRISVQIVSADDTEKLTQAKFGSAHDYILVGPDGRRFIYEETVGQARHGKLFRAGTWADATLPETMYAIFNQETFDAANIFTSSSFACRTEAAHALTSNQELLDAGIIVACDSVEILAEATGLDEAQLQNTLDTYNQYATDNHDPEFFRGKESYDEGMALSHVAGTVNNDASIEAFDLVPIEAPYYCVRLFPAILNTQGGPKRGAHGEVLDPEGNPIPGLFAAGEMGTIYAYKYNLGGNFSEAISSGRVAARNCADPDGTLASKAPTKEEKAPETKEDSAETEETPDAAQTETVDCSPCHDDAHKPGEENPHGY